MNRKNKNSISIKLIILIILVIILAVTSFKSGEKFYILKNTNFDDIRVTRNSKVLRWYFNARINY